MLNFFSMAATFCGSSAARVTEATSVVARAAHSRGSAAFGVLISITRAEQGVLVGFEELPQRGWRLSCQVGNRGADSRCGGAGESADCRWRIGVCVRHSDILPADGRCSSGDLALTDELRACDVIRFVFMPSATILAACPTSTS
jgi:hypothetical protein